MLLGRISIFYLVLDYGFKNKFIYPSSDIYYGKLSTLIAPVALGTRFTLLSNGFKYKKRSNFGDFFNHIKIRSNFVTNIGYPIPVYYETE